MQIFYILKGRLFAIGDIHGCVSKLKLLVQSFADLDRKDKIIFLGDYIDRGESSREVIDYIIDLRNTGLDIITLRGNHEEMLLGAYENKRNIITWLLNGGSFTLESFGIINVSELPARYLDFFYGLKYFYVFENFIFVHAGFNDEISDPFEDKFDMVWARRESYKNPVLKKYTIIHGHTPVPLDVCRKMIKEREQVINIDTGCIYGDTHGLGHLSAVELKSMIHYSV